MKQAEHFIKALKSIGSRMQKILKSTGEYIEQANKSAKETEARYIQQQAEQNRRQLEAQFNGALRGILAESLNKLSDIKYGLNKPYSKESIKLILPDGENWRAEFNIMGMKLSRVMLNELVADINLIFYNLYNDTVQEFYTEIGIARNSLRDCYIYYSYIPVAPSNNTEMRSFEQSYLQKYTNLYREKGNSLFLLVASDAVAVSDNNIVKVVLNFKVSNNLTAVYHPNNFFHHVNNG